MTTENPDSRLTELLEAVIAEARRLWPDKPADTLEAELRTHLLDAIAIQRFREAVPGFINAVRIADRIAARRIAVSDMEALAANQCHAGYAGDFGHHRCRYQDEIARLKFEALALQDSVDWLKARNEALYAALMRLRMEFMNGYSASDGVPHVVALADAVLNDKSQGKA